MRARAGFVLCSLVARSSARAEPQADSPYHKLAIFARALAHMEQSYVSDVDPDRLIYGAIRGMLGSLDPHSAFMDPEQFRILSDDSEGRYGGVGIEIDVARRLAHRGVGVPERTGRARRREARRSLPGDRRHRRARHADRTGAGAHARRARARRCKSCCAGPTPTEAIALTLTREVIEVRAVDARVLPDGIVYVRLKVFQETTAERAAGARSTKRSSARAAQRRRDHRRDARPARQPGRPAQLGGRGRRSVLERRRDRVDARPRRQADARAARDRRPARGRIGRWSC